MSPSTEMQFSTDLALINIRPQNIKVDDATRTNGNRSISWCPDSCQGKLLNLEPLWNAVSAPGGVFRILSKYFKMDGFAQRIVPECRRAARSFHCRGGFVELGHFDKNFVKNTCKNLHNFTTTCLIENLTQIWTQSGFFLPKSNHFFHFSKKGSGGLPPPP